MARAEVAWAAQEAREEFVISNLRALVLFAGALLCVIIALAMGGVVAVVASPPGGRIWVAGAITAGWVILAVILALSARARLRLKVRGILDPLKEDLRWVKQLLQRILN